LVLPQSCQVTDREHFKGGARRSLCVR
jgi:hypothetical protein